MNRRLIRWLYELLYWIDQGLHVILGGPKYIVDGGPVPSADETISSKVGRAAIKGRRWALIAERVIDTIWWPLQGWGHCRQSIEWDEVGKR